MQEYIEAIRNYPIIAKVTNRETLETAISRGISTMFLQNTDIFSAKACVDIAKEANCRIFLHIDLIDGLASSPRALDYVKSSMEPSGIISAHTTLIKYGQSQGMYCIQRFLITDSASFDEAVLTASKIQPSMVELMPGVIPSVTQRFSNAVQIPVIASGLITTKAQTISALSLGAVGVATRNPDLWHI